MTIVVFDPGTMDDVDFRDRVRRPMAGDGAGSMFLPDTEPSFIDTSALRSERLERLRNWMAEENCGGVALFDPCNQRHATGSRIMSGGFLRNSAPYFCAPAEGVKLEDEILITEAGIELLPRFPYEDDLLGRAA